MHPIPRALLIHTATLADAAADAYRDVTPTPLAELTRIRVETETALEAGRGGDTRTQTATLWYDLRQSRPRNTVFAVGQRVRFAGVWYRVERVTPQSDAHGVHHLEIGLAGPDGPTP